MFHFTCLWNSELRMSEFDGLKDLRELLIVHLVSGGDLHQEYRSPCGLGIFISL